jgi:hypothetical protein
MTTGVKSYRVARGACTGDIIAIVIDTGDSSILGSFCYGTAQHCGMNFIRIVFIFLTNTYKRVLAWFNVFIFFSFLNGSISRGVARPQIADT